MLVQALLHAQLAGIEWEQEKHRLLKMLAITLLGFAFLICMMLCAGGLLLAACWDTPYRLAALAGLTLFYGLGTAIAWRRFQLSSSLGGHIFAASLEELAADAALLKART